MNSTLKRLTSVLALVAVLFVFFAASTDVEAKKKKNTTKALDQNFASAASARILDGNTVAFTATLPSIPKSDDGILYLYQLACYEYAIPATAPIGQVAMSQTPTFTFALNHKTANTRLYSKFALAVKVNGVMTMISNPQYITNPEVLATKTHARQGYAKKGLQGKDFLNIDVSVSDASIYRARTLQIMNNGANQALTNPYSRAGIMAVDPHPQVASYYMLNAADATGVNLLINKMESFASAASATDNWIIGNEVNVRKWNYLAFTSWEDYMRQYEQVFRICYIAIKSTNANANVYICLDQNWDRNRKASHPEYYEYMDGKDFIDKFAADMNAGGNIGWLVAQHPYPVPLYYAKVWDMSGTPDGAYMASMINKNYMVSFQNISTITKYLASNPALYTPQGTVRTVLLSEIGICNAQGADVQAACLYASYYAAATNPYIEQIIYSSANHGTFDSTFTPQAQDMFNNMDGANAQAYMARAMAIMGITNMAQVVK